mmetsp:Transcript_17233/g.42738  ORF Transcript_17233/g.42738 Transcript_17233/m.42738 type:complete len:255 (+) Transcript_17233:2334-3098(+)
MSGIPTRMRRLSPLRLSVRWWTRGRPLRRGTATSATRWQADRTGLRINCKVIMEERLEEKQARGLPLPINYAHSLRLRNPVAVGAPFITEQMAELDIQDDHQDPRLRTTRRGTRLLGHPFPAGTASARPPYPLESLPRTPWNLTPTRGRRRVTTARALCRAVLKEDATTSRTGGSRTATTSRTGGTSRCSRRREKCTLVRAGVVTAGRLRRGPPEFIIVVRERNMNIRGERRSGSFRRLPRSRRQGSAAKSSSV